MRFFIVAALVAVCALFAPASIQAACQSDACWHRVHIHRANHWCVHNENCLWRSRFNREPASWRVWYDNTADCETMGYEPKAVKAKVDTGNTYKGAVQFAQGTWDSAQKYLRPRWRFYGYIPGTSYEHQGVVAIELAQHEGKGHWPVCG